MKGHTLRPPFLTGRKQIGRVAVDWNLGEAVAYGIGFRLVALEWRFEFVSLLMVIILGPWQFHVNARWPKRKG